MVRRVARRALVSLALPLLLGLALACSRSAPASGKPILHIGSTNFTEQQILAELYGQALQANGYTVERRTNLGPREIVEPALESGQIDMYVDYLATLLAFLSPAATPGAAASAAGDAASTATALQQALQPRGITALDYAPAVDTNGLVVTRATADKYHLAKTSDLAPVAGQLVLGGPPECPQRPYCLPGLRDTYGIVFKDFKPLDAGGPLTVAALQAGEVDVAVLFTTDAAIAAREFVLLADDKHLQAADNIVPLVRDEWLTRAPADFKTVVNGVSAQITTDALTSLNKQVGIDRKEPRDVAAAWLKEKGLMQ